ncbi:MAG: hypothetical protein ACREHD_11375, partial [Pirellulales bacterium]
CASRPHFSRLSSQIEPRIKRMGTDMHRGYQSTRKKATCKLTPGHPSLNCGTSAGQTRDDKRITRQNNDGVAASSGTMRPRVIFLSGNFSVIHRAS